MWRGKVHKHIFSSTALPSSRVKTTIFLSTIYGRRERRTATASVLLRLAGVDRRVRIIKRVLSHIGAPRDKKATPRLQLLKFQSEALLTSSQSYEKEKERTKERTKGRRSRDGAWLKNDPSIERGLSGAREPVSDRVRYQNRRASAPFSFFTDISRRRFSTPPPPKP